MPTPSTRAKLASFRRYQASPDSETFRLLWEMQQRMPEVVQALFAQMEQQLQAKAEASVQTALDAAIAALPEALRAHAADIIAKMRQGPPGASIEGPPGPKPRLGVDYTIPEPIPGPPGPAGPKPVLGVDYSVPDPIPGPPGSPDTPDDIASKVNTLEEQIELHALKGFKKIIEELRGAIRRAGADKKGGGGGMGMPQHEVFAIGTATLSVRTAYPIAAGGYAIFKAAYQGQALDRGVHYTVGADRRTLTFDAATQAEFIDGTAFSVTYIRG